MSRNTFQLDLDKTVLKGFQRLVVGGNLVNCVNTQLITEMFNLINKKFIFPPVPVTEENGTFYLTFLYDRESKKYDGGHHRAIAHWLKGEPLECRYLNDKDHLVYPLAKPPVLFKPIRNFVLLDDSYWEGYSRTKKRQLWKV